MVNTISAEYELITDTARTAAIRVRPMSVQDAINRNTRGANLVNQQAQSLDGSLPLYPAFNNLLVRDPTTLQYANEGYSRNSLIFNIFTRRAQAIHQAKLLVHELDNDLEKADVAKDTDYQRLLNRPNPYMTARVFWQTIELYVCCGGTAFIHKDRDEYGVVRALYPYHTSQMNYIQGSQRWVDGYVYDNGAGYRREFSTDDIFEIKFPSVNFFYPFKAMSPLLSLLKEVNVDNQRGELEVALLQNGGTPSFAIYPGESVQPMTQDQIDTSIEKIITKINGRNRGKPLLMNPNFKLERMGYSPREMLLTDFSLIPETRACGVYGVPAGYAQLLSGLQYAGTYANRETDKRTMFEDAIVPAWIAYAEDVNGGMANEMFHDGTKCSEHEVAFDYADIPALMEANDKIQGRIVEQWQANMRPLNDALTELGLEPLASSDPKGMMYFTELTGLLEASFVKPKPESQPVVPNEKSKPQEEPAEEE